MKGIPIINPTLEQLKQQQRNKTLEESKLEFLKLIQE